MSYFKGLKLTKKGEQLQAKINGNLSETLHFTKAKLGSGTIVSDDEARFLTDLKEAWGNAVISKCTLEEENTMVAIELQFTNAELTQDKIFREIGLYAQGNDGEEVLYAYSNAGDNYDYIPLMQDSPHSFIITIYFTITSGTKISANIDLNSYVSVRKFNEEMAKKVNKTDFATENTYGIVKYGIEEGTALEGKRLAEALGVEKYGGLLNQSGRKTEGYAYYDKNTKEMYYCYQSHNNINTPSASYFKPFSNKAILTRLENLHTFQMKVIENENVKITFFHDQDDRICYGSIFVKKQFRINTDRIVCKNTLNRKFDGVIVTTFKGSGSFYFFRGFFLQIEEGYIYADTGDFTVFTS